MQVQSTLVTSTLTYGSTVENQRVSPFMRLPAELRNTIYSLVSDTTSITLDKDNNLVPSHSGSVLAMLSRQIRSEAAGYFYSPGILSIDPRVKIVALIGLLDSNTFANTTSYHTVEMGFDTATSICFMVEWMPDVPGAHPCNWIGYLSAPLPCVRRVVVMKDERQDDTPQQSAEKMSSALAVAFNKKKLEVLLHWAPGRSEESVQLWKVYTVVDDSGKTLRPWTICASPADIRRSDSGSRK